MGKACIEQAIVGVEKDLGGRDRRIAVRIRL